MNKYKKQIIENYENVLTIPKDEIKDEIILLAFDESKKQYGEYGPPYLYIDLIKTFGEQSPLIKHKLIEFNGDFIRYIDHGHRTRSLCLEAVKNNEDAILNLEIKEIDNDIIEYLGKDCIIEYVLN